MSDIWITSDTHWGHKNILKFSKNTRRGLNVEEMGELLVEQWNSQVAVDDQVYHLGDLSFLNAIKTKDVLSRLKGNLHLIKGNHDTWINETTKPYLTSLHDIHTIKYNKFKIVLCHYPIADFEGMHYGHLHLHGHTHSSYTHPGRGFDVGIDNRPDNTMALWNIEELIPILIDKPILPHIKCT